MGWFGFGEKKDTTEAIVKGPWDVYTYVYGEGLRAMITFDVPAAHVYPHAGHPHCRRVIFYSPVEEVMPNGLPNGRELERLARAEEALIAELGQRGTDCRKVGHMLYGAMRDVVFQCQDPAAFAAGFEAWKSKSAVPLGRVELVARDGGWSFFDEKIRPKQEHWEWIQDSHVVRALLQNGCDPHALLHITHHFVGPPEPLTEVTRLLRERGLTPVSRGPGNLVLTQDLPPDVDVIHTWTQRFRGLARAAHARYDGWGAPVVRP